MSWTGFLSQLLEIALVGLKRVCGEPAFAAEMSRPACRCVTKVGGGSDNDIVGLWHRIAPCASLG